MILDGIRKVLADQSLEGAIIHLYDLIQRVIADVEDVKRSAPQPPVEEPKKEEF